MTSRPDAGGRRPLAILTATSRPPHVSPAKPAGAARPELLRRGLCHALDEGPACRDFGADYQGLWAHPGRLRFVNGVRNHLAEFAATRRSEN